MLDVVRTDRPSFVLPAKSARALAAEAAHKVAHVLMWPARAWEARRLLNQLGGLSDHELADIGISRSDVANAAASPVDADPSLVLVRARRERLAGRDAIIDAWRTND